jgi:hypothetical protein
MAAMAGATLDSAYVLRSATRQIRVLTGDEHQLVQDGPAAMINREEDDCGGGHAILTSGQLIALLRTS